MLDDGDPTMNMPLLKLLSSDDLRSVLLEVGPNKIEKLCQ